jgi:iron(III) transport system ATP-binding protein
MNQGRIEQVDDPHTLYTRPKTRFVAGFIGRTNFVDGTCNGTEIAFDSFAVARNAIVNGGALAGTVTFSVRPQSIRLVRAPAVADGHRPQVEVKVVERAYLGEFWDYVAVPVAGSTRFRVTAAPSDIYQKGETAWLELDPQQMTPIV